MFKRAAAAVVSFIAIILIFSACNKSPDIAEEKPRSPFCITATVLEIREKSILVNEDGEEYGKIDVSLDKVKNVPDLSVGNKIRVYYTGGIAESYPAQINNAWRIEVIKN